MSAALAKESGVYFDERHIKKASKVALDTGNQEWLWQESERVTRCSYPATL